MRILATRRAFTLCAGYLSSAMLARASGRRHDDEGVVRRLCVFQILDVVWRMMEGGGQFGRNNVTAIFYIGESLPKFGDSLHLWDYQLLPGRNFWSPYSTSIYFKRPPG
jgi:hypothetical protein